MSSSLEQSTTTRTFDLATPHSTPAIPASGLIIDCYRLYNHTNALFQRYEADDSYPTYQKGGKAKNYQVPIGQMNAIDRQVVGARFIPMKGITLKGTRQVAPAVPLPIGEMNAIYRARRTPRV